MLDGIKRMVRDRKLNQARARLEADTAYCKDRYLGWIKEVEPGLIQEYTGASDVKQQTQVKCVKLGVSQCRKGEALSELSRLEGEDVILLALDSSCVAPAAGRLYQKAFSEQRELALVYADEDYSYEGQRVAPFMKPDFSPDTLLAFPYFGGSFAIRKKEYDRILDEMKKLNQSGSNQCGLDQNAASGMISLEEMDDRAFLYALSLRSMVHCMKSGCEDEIGHLPFVLHHNAITKEELQAYRQLEEESYRISDCRELTADENLPWYDRLYGHMDKYDALRVQVANEMSPYGAELVTDEKGVRQLVYHTSGKDASAINKPMVSIVIPSKDNLEVLMRLLDSIYELTAYPRESYEVIVVDNGSDGATRTRLMNVAHDKGNMIYLYEPMEFNFSKMMNLGVSRAKGEYILLLNDDTKVCDANWLDQMVGQALLPHVGAVGAKLLYPDSGLIQHTGVTNLAVGPAHKLQKKRDDVSYYYGRNRMVYDYAAVTAACLLVSKDKYLQVGGFDEEIKVAFNDVDFCYSLLEKGYYNVMRPDVTLWHYESLSRGDDLKSKEKTRRMLAERDKLYDKHEWMWGKDPFYSRNLIGNAIDYLINFKYVYEREAYRTPFRPFEEAIQPEWFNDSIYITIEHNELVDALEERNIVQVHHISGWAYVLDQDNARYEMHVVLKTSDGRYLIADTPRHWRPDVVQILPEQVNVQMSGFLARADQGTLPVGEYSIMIYMKDFCSRQRLLKDSGQILKVE